MYVVVFITAKDSREANKIIKQLVTDKLIACANIVKDIKSVFWWQGKVDHAKEVLLILKSKKKLIPQIIKTVKGLHSYTVPEIIAMPVIEGNKDYLKWIDESTGGCGG